MAKTLAGTAATAATVATAAAADCGILLRLMLYTYGCIHNGGGGGYPASNRLFWSAELICYFPRSKRHARTIKPQLYHAGRGTSGWVSGWVGEIITTTTATTMMQLSNAHMSQPRDLNNIIFHYLLNLLTEQTAHQHSTPLWW